MNGLTLRDRAEAFRRAFPDREASWPSVVQEQGRDVLYATWVCGQDYRNRSGLYGAYPHGYLDRLEGFYPDQERLEILHAFAGSVPPGNYSRVDLVDRVGVPDCRFHEADVCDVAAIFKPERFDVVIADPPYSRADAGEYGTPMVNRGKATAALAKVTKPGGHLAWLDCVWPMFSKDKWVTVGRITVIRSTNHRVRLLTIFERV